MKYPHATIKFVIAKERIKPIIEEEGLVFPNPYIEELAKAYHLKEVANEIANTVGWSYPNGKVEVMFGEQDGIDVKIRMDENAEACEDKYLTEEILENVEGREKELFLTSKEKAEEINPHFHCEIQSAIYEF